jgi:hypothetical protein
MFGWLVGTGKRREQKDAARVRALAIQIARRISARYDAAQTTVENSRHWAAADDLSADAAANPEVRRILRRRARYELANGGYANGMNKQKANDLIGSGPRLQMLLDDEAQNQKLEAEWKAWADATRFARTLRTACRAKVRCGEALGLIVSNPKLPTLAKVQLHLLECDRLTTPNLRAGDPDRIDGIDFDQYGNPVLGGRLRPAAQFFHAFNDGITQISDLLG